MVIDSNPVKSLVAADRVSSHNGYCIPFKPSTLLCRQRCPATPAEKDYTGVLPEIIYNIKLLSIENNKNSSVASIVLPHQ